MKRISAMAISLCLLLMVCLFVLPTEAHAATEGYYTYTISNDEATITDVDTSISGAVIIPNMLGGYPVTYIGDRAFYACESMTSVTIPNGVVSIGESAFEKCTGLKSVYFPPSITRVEIYAFSWSCSNIETVYICDRDAWDNITFEVDFIGWLALRFSSGYDISSNPTAAGADLVLHCWSGGSCTSYVSCTFCGITGNDFGHTWLDASCTTSKVCFICGITEGEPLGHNWQEATCANPKTCSGCGKTEGNALGHNWLAATCAKAKTCSVCSKTEGSALGHSWIAATCTTLKTCSVCSKTEGSVLEHSWIAANCTTPKTCSSCGKTEGTIQHTWAAANCTMPKTCTSCGKTEGTVYHTYINAEDTICHICGESRVLIDPNLKFHGNPGLSFQEYIGIQILFVNSTASDYSKVYVVSEQETPEGIVKTTSYGTQLYANKYTMFEQKIVSWSMTETVTITLYGVKNDVVYQGASLTASVKQLAMEKLAIYKAQNSMISCRALVDMLNYGATVQTVYNRNVLNLPNADLGEYASYGSTNDPVLQAINSVTGTGEVMVYANSISLQDKVEIQIVFTSDVSAYEVVATLDGNAVDFQIDTSLRETYGYTIIKLPIATAYLRNTYTVALYDDSGKPVTQIYNVSVEGYANARKNTEKHAVDVALMRYGDSVAAILRGDDATENPGNSGNSGPIELPMIPG